MANGIDFIAPQGAYRFTSESGPNGRSTNTHGAAATLGVFGYLTDTDVPVIWQAGVDAGIGAGDDALTLTATPFYRLGTFVGGLGVVSGSVGPRYAFTIERGESRHNLGAVLRAHVDVPLPLGLYHPILPIGIGVHGGVAVGFDVAGPEAGQIRMTKELGGTLTWLF